MSATQPNFCSRSSELRPSGFTLAEVLITLVIIGVIAAITVPTLIVKYQKEQTVTRFKKAYSTLAQTTARAVADNGSMKTWEIKEGTTEETTKDFSEKYLLPYLSIMKNASTYNIGGWNPQFVYLQGEAGIYGTNAIRWYLPDGMSLTMYMQTNSSSLIRFKIDIDVNGDKKPNKIGKDIFSVYYYIFSEEYPNFAGKFIPDGGWRSKEDLTSDDNDYACIKNKYGCHCPAKIISDSWQIKDDYPW